MKTSPYTQFRSIAKNHTKPWPLACVLASVLALLLAAPAAHAQTFSVIHTFAYYPQGDGGMPQSGVSIHNGVIYGTTGSSGLGLGGTLYQLSHTGDDWSYVIDGYSRYAGPTSRPVFGPDSHPYMLSNGAGNRSAGAVLDMFPPPLLCRTAKCSLWTPSILYTFQGAFSQDGYGPGRGDVIWDQQGNIYGVTNYGGLYDIGTVWEMTPAGNTWTETPIYHFTGGADGGIPIYGVIFDAKGNLFGVTLQGGANNMGTVFELTYVQGVGWQETVLYNFTGGSDGQGPVGGLIFDNAGNLYGTTNKGGTGGCGTAFELSPAGQTWNFTTLYSFAGPSNYNCGPWTSLTMDTAGNLYGTTFLGGAHQLGNVFRLSNTPNGWVYTSLHDFTEGADGGQPISNVTIDTDGALYGTTWIGGSGYGVVWQIKP